MSRPSSNGRGAASLLCALLLTLLACFGAAAQTANSTAVRGTVTDPQGNVVAGATVTITNVETNVARNQTTNESGSFTFDLLPPGTYRVEVEAAGFKKSVTTDVRAIIANPTQIIVVVEVGNVAESVTVSAGAGEVLLNTHDATLGKNYVSEQITQLPLDARDPR